MVQMKTMMNNVLRLSFSKMIEVETREWPPKCLVFAYQPQRPKIISNTNKISDAAISKRNER